jgi:hypothetical protein
MALIFLIFLMAILLNFVFRTVASAKYDKEIPELISLINALLSNHTLVSTPRVLFSGWRDISAVSFRSVNFIASVHTTNYNLILVSWYPLKNQIIIDNRSIYNKPIKIFANDLNKLKALIDSRLVRINV